MRINQTRSLRSHIADDPNIEIINANNNDNKKLMSFSSNDSFKNKQKRVVFASSVKNEEEDEDYVDGQLDNMDDVFSDIKIDATLPELSENFIGTRRKSKSDEIELNQN